MNNDTHDAIFYVHGIAEQRLAAFGFVGLWRGQQIVEGNGGIDPEKAKIINHDIATYYGIASILYHLLNKKYYREVEIRSSNSRVINHLAGIKIAISPEYDQIVRDEIKNRAKWMQKIYYVWVPLDQNEEARKQAITMLEKLRGGSDHG